MKLEPLAMERVQSAWESRVAWSLSESGVHRLRLEELACGLVRESLPGDDLLAGLRGQANAVVITTDLLGVIATSQLDGSLTQTAYALLSDLVTVRKRQRARHAVPARRTPGW